MWKLKWFQRKQPNLKVENVNHIAIYDLIHDQKGTKVILAVHLPSKRVSEKHYNEAGTIVKYIAQSPMADEHIRYLCAQDTGLSKIMKNAEERAKSIERNKHIRRKGYKIVWNVIGITCIIIYIILLIGRC